MLLRARKAAGYSNAQKFLAAVTESGRKAPSYSTYAQWESGKVRPREETLEPIIAFHRERDTWPESAAPTPNTELALASAITLLVDELRETRKERDEIRERLEAVEAAIRLLNAADDPTDAAPPARVR